MKEKTYNITTFGCQMNVSDSERIKAVCKSMGYKEEKNFTEDRPADVYVINTCSIRQKAEDRVLGMGKKFKKLKALNPNLKVVITGCMVKRDLRAGEERSNKFQQDYETKLKKQMPWLDHILEINEIYKLPKLLGENTDEKIEDYFAIPPKYNSKFQAFVPISTGCNKFCTFCIVPFTRGKEIYRSYDEIYKEVLTLVKNGYKEITLLGQNVNSWKSEIDGKPSDFADLLERLAQIQGEFWLRFTSSHPYDINMRLIDVIEKYDNIAKQVHFAMQSGSDPELKRMNRHYTIDEFKNKVKQIKKNINGVGVTTDVIVGFCGQTEKEFLDTCRVMTELKFDMAYISEYSQRGATIAAKFYKDDIPNEVKRERKEILEKVLRSGVEENNTNLIGQNLKVMIYKNKIKNRSGIFAKTSSGKDVLINKFKSESNDYKLGQFINVRITGFQKFCLDGIEV